jgi:non-ribosomal peptide synthetase component E (peptide arylation enzyme)
LADYKAPDHVCLVDSLPVTPLAKIDKRALVKLATASCVERRRISIQ